MEDEMKIHTKDYRVREGEEVDLKKRPTTVSPVYGSASRYEDILANHVEKLSELQQLHYASSRHAVLLIFQAMDAAGKDGAIRHVMSGVNPQGCQVFSFKHPSATELEHDFLWRNTRDLPERGGSEFSTGPTTRRCSSSASIAASCTAKISPTRPTTTASSGMTDTGRSGI
jgi:polyphosphate kinase 2 (PPK2 family)